MRNLHIPSRSPAYAKNGMVATSHPDATKMALNLLEKGGNAFDAAICAASILGVVEAHSTGIGGDCFCIFYSHKDRTVKALNGSGRSIFNIDYNKVKITLTTHDKGGITELDYDMALFAESCFKNYI